MKMNVLIVDDCSVMRLMMKRTLKLSDIAVGEIFEAADGEEALRYVDTERIDLILLDLYMPVMDGMEVLDTLRNRSVSKNIPILIVSTESNSSMIEQIEKLGTAFIHKPFTPEKLREEIYKISNDQLTFNASICMN
ncbi:response regulator [Rhodohalobacter sp. SW132]|uniref:response regulator n=1 Tax=Rhodohalobacter sp. SW132 TaxID=2293433 RepID=UPI000E23BC8E|nr:response regulator [Rhodohalobacter sp. SW132]REL38703.1 response regulator [Rhodohalobacter sp. SW132]